MPPTNRRMGDDAINPRGLKAHGATTRTLTPARIVEPKHWHLACKISITLQDTGPNGGAGVPCGGLHFAAREVPQSAPERSDGADDPNHRRQQGAKPVRISNGQQRT